MVDHRTCRPSELDIAYEISGPTKERYFEGGYERRLLDGVGHFVPREAPAAVMRAMYDALDRSSPVQRP